MNNGQIVVTLTIPYLSEVITNHAMEENVITQDQSIIIKKIEFDEEHGIYLADCDITSPTVH